MEKPACLIRRVRLSKGVYKSIDIVQMTTMGLDYVSNQKTVRQLAKDYGVSKTTTHRILSVDLPKINKLLSKDVKKRLKRFKKSNKSKITK